MDDFYVAGYDSFICVMEDLCVEDVFVDENTLQRLTRQK